MKEQFKDVFKETPESFRYSVRSAIIEAEQSPQRNQRFSKAARVALAVVLILMLIPTAVFGASKLIGLIAQPVSHYGVAISIASQPTSDYPAYVKMQVDVPVGFIVEPNTDDLKFTEINSDDSYAHGAFSLCPMRPKNGSDAEVISNVDRYEEITLCGRSAYRIKQTHSRGYDRVYISYSEMNVLLLIYYENVSEVQLAEFVSGIRFTEGTASDHTQLWELFDERIEDKAVSNFSYTNIEYPRDTIMIFSAYSEKNGDESLRYTAQITDVRYQDDLEGIDSSLINPMYTDNEDLMDGSGRLLPRTVTVTKAGDGFNTADEVLSSENMTQKLLLIDITYTSLSNEDTVVYIPYSLETYNKTSDGSYDYAWNIDTEKQIAADAYCDREIFYVSEAIDTVQSFYCIKLKADETKTVTIGYRCCTEMLDKAYLTIYDATSESIVDPDPYADVTKEEIHNYLIKVQ